MEKLIKISSLATWAVGRGMNKAIVVGFLSIFLSSVASGQCSFNTIVSTTAASCGGTNGTATVFVTGTAGPKYSWSSGGTSFKEKDLPAGIYTCTITDKLNCSETVTAIVQSNPAVTANANITNVSCGGGNNGSIGLTTISGGTGPYTYSWSPGGQNTANISNLTAGTYICTITSNNGCTGFKSIDITEPSSITPTVSKTNVSCTGTNDGSASVTITGGSSPYSYSWSPGGSTGSSISNLTAGTYTVTITDNKGCQKTASATIIKPTGFTTNVVYTNVTCKGGSDGSATVMTTGGTAPFIYAWSPSGGATANAKSLKEGTYLVDVVDANGCSGANSVKISAFSNISATANVTNVTCTGTNNGSIQLTPKNGIAPYTYKWTGSSSTSATRNSLTVGAYTYTITDSYNCAYSATANVTKSVCTEIIPVANAVDLLIYPNPAREYIKIESPVAISKVKLVDSKGRVVLETEGENEMNLPNLEKGIYFVFLSSENGSIVKKLSIE